MSTPKHDFDFVSFQNTFTIFVRISKLLLQYLIFLLDFSVLNLNLSIIDFFFQFKYNNIIQLIRKLELAGTEILSYFLVVYDGHLAVRTGSVPQQSHGMFVNVGIKWTPLFFFKEKNESDNNLEVGINWTILIKNWKRWRTKIKYVNYK